MEYNIRSKITEYNGITFRSRLEAKWAAFFDLIGWEYVYEPSEISGYNPDFLLKCKSEAYNTSICVVEVKPTVFIDDDFKKNTLKKYSDLKAHILILSDFPFTQTEYENVSIGIGSQYLGEEHENHTQLYYFEMKCEDDFGSEYMKYDGMIYGNITRKHFVKPKDEEALCVNHLWRAAGNTTQFKMQ